jgi:exopolysaccharide biosynthesis polyprenyl glycosylphosphotransferase
MSNRSKALLLLFVDIFILLAALFLVIYARRLGNPDPNYLLQHYELFSYIFPFWILMYFIEGLYTLKTYNPANLPVSLLRGTAFSVVISIVITYLLHMQLEKITPKTNLVLVAVVSLPLLFWWRTSFFKYFSKEQRLRNTFIIGSQETINLVKHEISRKPYLGYRIVATCTADESGPEIPKDVQLIAIERHMPREHALYQKVFNLLGSGIEVMDLAKFAEQISGKIPIKAIDESWFIEYCGYQSSRSNDIIKSIIDSTVAVILMILLIPVAIVVLPILLIVHGRPIFFKQLRTGLNNKPFTLYKLRTMIINAEKDGAQWAKPGDVRITPLGNVLRKTRLDELPQLINILKGEMSLVGPRPERPEIIERQLASHIPYYALRHLVKPGVTGWAQVTFRYGFSQEDSKEKLQYDLFYVKNRSIWLDILVIIKTIKTVLTGAGQ